MARHHQYILKFPRWHDWEVPPRQRKQGYLGFTYIRRIKGEWYVFRNRWKADWFCKYGEVACLHAPTLQELRVLIQKSKDARFGYRP